MSERSIAVRLRAEISDFQRQMAQAADSTEKLSAKFDKNGQKIETLSGQMVRSAQIHRSEWNTAGQSLLMLGGAVTALGVAALKTGIEYNTLQQTTRKALGTLLGDAEAANAQMDKLDEFARTSPFAKQVFIQAQQQMLGFGIETEKVIPYLDAIQNSVAAFGGSNHDIAELSRIMSQISASSKITAMDLREFGNRGVDAATIIGSQMGKTGAQIREEITAGTLDAHEALDALAAGMQERFGGAAAGVKDTFEGSIDRVKAAWRDLASELATPLVDPNGGGLLVDLANNAADVMRAFQALPEPLKTATVAMGGAVGAAGLLGGSFLILGPRVLDTITAFQTIKVMAPAVAGALRTIGMAAGAAAGAFVIITTLLDIAQRQGDHLVEEIQAMAEGWEQLSAAGVSGLTADLNEYTAAVRDTRQENFIMRNQLGEMYRELGRERAIIEASEQIQTMNSTIANTQINLKMLANESGYTFEQLERLAKQNGIDLAFASNTEQAKAAREQLLELAHQANDTGGAYGELTGDIIDTNKAMMENIALMNELAGVALDERAALRNLEAAFDAVTAAVDENGRTLDITTEAGRANQAALDDIAGSTHDLIEAMQTAGASSEDMRAVMARSREEFIESAEAAGMTRREAEELADQLKLIPEFVGTTFHLDVSQALRNLSAVMGSMDAIQRHNYLLARNTYATGGQIEKLGHYGTGGSIMGYSPTPHADNIPIMATAGEYMQPVASVNHYGVDVMEAMRRRDDGALWRALAAKGVSGGDTATGGVGGALGARALANNVQVSLAGATVQVVVDGHQMTGYVASVAGQVQEGQITPADAGRASW